MLTGWKSDRAGRQDPVRLALGACISLWSGKGVGVGDAARACASCRGSALVDLGGNCRRPASSPEQDSRGCDRNGWLTGKVLSAAVQSAMRLPLDVRNPILRSITPWCGLAPREYDKAISHSPIGRSPGRSPEHGRLRNLRGFDGLRANRTERVAACQSGACPSGSTPGRTSTGLRAIRAQE